MNRARPVKKNIHGRLSGFLFGHFLTDGAIQLETSTKLMLSKPIRSENTGESLQILCRCPGIGTTLYPYFDSGSENIGMPYF